MRRVLPVLVLSAFVAACGNSSDADLPTGGDPIPDNTAAVIVETTTASGASAMTIDDQAVETTQADLNDVAALPDPGAGMRYYGELAVPQVLDGFDFGPTWLDGQQLVVGIADTSELRQRGLMFVENLGDLDGMLFIFEQDSTGRFWMKNTLIPLDIAFFDADGAFVDGFVMEPCTTANCPKYGPDGTYRYALEMAAGTMPANPARLELIEPEGTPSPVSTVVEE